MSQVAFSRRKNQDGVYNTSCVLGINTCKRKRGKQGWAEKEVKLKFSSDKTYHYGEEIWSEYCLQSVLASGSNGWVIILPPHWVTGCMLSEELCDLWQDGSVWLGRERADSWRLSTDYTLCSCAECFALTGDLCVYHSLPVGLLRSTS